MRTRVIELIFRKVVENVYVIVGKPAYANVAAIVLPEQVVMVDCGIQVSAAKEVRREIEQISEKRVETVVLTHFHSDHTHALSEFSDCRIVSSNLLSKNLKSAVRRTVKELRPVFPNETFDDQLEITDHDVRLVARRTGGHTDCSTHVHCASYGVVVAGDNLVWSCYPWGARNSDPDVWVRTLREYLSLDAEHFVPGHGSVGGKHKVAELLGYLDGINSLMRQMIASGKDEREVLRAAQGIPYSQSRTGPTHVTSLRNWFRFWRVHSG